MPLTDRFLLAFELAFHLQTRKGSPAPYITHLMAVAALTGEFGGTEEQMIAAMLHDAVEDQGGAATRERIREAFGDHIVELVDACSDTDESPKPPWQARKEAFLEKTRHLPGEARLIVAADKLHNIRALLMDYEQHGEALWERFKGKREGTLWYHEAVVAALSEGWEHPILDVLGAEYGRLAAAAGGNPDHV